MSDSRQTLRDLQPGRTATIVSVDGNDPSVLRLHDLGLVPGTRVRAIRCAPLGCPLEIYVRGIHLSLRCEEALRIHVEPC